MSEDLKGKILSLGKHVKRAGYEMEIDVAGEKLLLLYLMLLLLLMLLLYLMMLLMLLMLPPLLMLWL